MKKEILKKKSGITLIALIITIIILLILAGVGINLLVGQNGMLNKTEDAVEATKRESAVEKVKLMLDDYMSQKYTGNKKTLEEYLYEQKEKGELDNVTNNGDGTITVEVDGYEITIKEDNLELIQTEKAGGVKPTFEVLITKINGNKIEPNQEDTIEQKAMTINITNIEEFGENYTIKVKDSSGNILIKENNVIANIKGQASYIINKKGIYTIIVTGTKEGKIRTAIKTEEIKLAVPIIEESAMFSKANGVIDIVWLNTDNTVRQTPLSPKDHAGGLTPVKYSTSENKWVETDKNNDNHDWYAYNAQTGNTDGKTSNWANAVANYEGAEKEKAYFVWIPRYAYKITYFNTQDQAKAYRENGSTEGIVGYSNIEGIVKIENGVEKLLNDSKPTNVTGKVETSQYADYIPHPAFQFGDGTTGIKAGIWVGKFESSGNSSKVTIIPNTKSLSYISVSQIIPACQGVKNIYGLTGDTHMMKNTQWGAVSYLAESKYGRNGTAITANGKTTNDVSKNQMTGAGNYISNVLQSTTGNMYGIYDMSGTLAEPVAGVFAEKIKHPYYYDFTNMDTKYYDIYVSYDESKKIKGDGVYETSTANLGTNSWYKATSSFVNNTRPLFFRGR